MYETFFVLNVMRFDLPKMHHIAILLAILVVGVYANDRQSSGSMPTSLAGLENLLETERFLIKRLEDYANALRDKLIVIRSAIKIMRTENDRSKDDPEKYLQNPINTFSLIRRMYADWLQWEQYLKKPVGKEQINILKQKQVDLPTSEDLNEAVNAIIRIQKTYELNVADMSLGLLNRRQYNASFAAVDCATIGFVMFEQQLYHDSLIWLHRAIHMYKNNKLYEVLSFSKIDLMKMYATNMLKLNRAKDALQVIGTALREFPKNTELLHQKVEIEALIRTNNYTPIKEPLLLPDNYARGCRGEFSKQLSKMYCVYNSTTTPFLKLAPFKMEILHLDPYMVLYHDVISDREIEELKRLAYPRLKRATVSSVNGTERLITQERTAKAAWLSYNTSHTTMRLNQRIADMTGFDLVGSESLQVINYGLGGHYDVHYDFFGNTKLSDVEQGGATVFPNITTAFFPKKGTAILWYNLNNRGVGDVRTLHAACPVLVGSKWVVSKWISEGKQIFRRPCYKE